MGAIRIANCSGFYGDRLAAAREMVDGGPIDVLTGDYLAELTMMILWKTRESGGSGGYARTFVRQMEDVLGTVLERGIRVVTNAGGLNPRGLADAVREVARGLGLAPKIAYIEGDDVRERLAEFRAAGHDLAHLDRGIPFQNLPGEVVTANAYLGSWGIVEALDGGADVVVCPRVTDAALTVGPAAWHHGWRRDAWDRLAAAVVAGHVIECGAHATGGNYAFFQDVPRLEHPGFPIAEIDTDGTVDITKHDGHGGMVSVGTVTAQLVYEVAGPRYLTPDVTARLDSIAIGQAGPDRVRISGVRGEPAPATTKVGINYLAGFRNSMTFLLTGLDIEEKAELVVDSLFARVGGRDSFDKTRVELIRSDHEDAPTNEMAFAYLRVVVQDRDPRRVGRQFSNACVELGLASYPGFTTTSPPGREEPYAAMWPALVPADLLEQTVHHDDGRRVRVAEAAPGGEDVAPVEPPGSAVEAPTGPTRRAPLGELYGARSGDKGGNANCGLWAADDAAYAWLRDYLTADRFRALLPEARDMEVHRYELPNLRALNFVVVGLLGDGVGASFRMDPQAKSLGEYVRSRHAEIPLALLERNGDR
jgi:Acyclic terpene utilisation family protein AtuA